MSIQTLEPIGAAPPPRNGHFRFRVRDTTDSVELDVEDIQRGTPAGVVAQAMAARMELPGNVSYALREERGGSWLRDDLPVDEQVEDAEPMLRLTPKARLG